MKSRLFALTRNEQRVIVLAIVLLLIAAFVRYSGDLKLMRKINKPVEAAKPLGPPSVPSVDMDESDADERGEGSPHSSPRLPR